MRTCRRGVLFHRSAAMTAEGLKDRVTGSLTDAGKWRTFSNDEDSPVDVTSCYPSRAGGVSCPSTKWGTSTTIALATCLRLSFCSILCFGATS